VSVKLNSNLIFDFGIGNGEDSRFYLHKGYSVVAVDADPLACKELELNCSSYLKTRLTVINCVVGGTSSASGFKKFYKNLDFPNLSSVNFGWANRDGGKIEEMWVKSLPLKHFFENYGLPYYLKSDIEGSEMGLLSQLKLLKMRPAYISVEDCRFGPKYLETLIEIGYENFAIIDQSNLESQKSEEDFDFGEGSSGSFGPWLKANWMSRDVILKAYYETIRDKNGTRIAPASQWFDLHATS
jgi:FkbM family methyltransferase